MEPSWSLNVAQLAFLANVDRLYRFSVTLIDFDWLLKSSLGAD